MPRSIRESLESQPLSGLVLFAVTYSTILTYQYIAEALADSVTPMIIPALVLTIPVLIGTRLYGTAFYSAFFSPFRWCAYRVGAIMGIFREIATYFVRSRGWSVVLAIAMGLEGYQYQLPLIEQDPKYENMPTAAEQRALAMRAAWIDRHVSGATQTFSKLVVTSADITLLLRAIAADLSLVHAAYYTDDECIARIADWIAAEDNPRVQ